MTGLHDIVEAGARSALARQREDGSMLPGHNGLYGHPETPLRNTGHWLLTWLGVWERSGDPSLRSAAERALAVLLDEKARPCAASFLHRQADGLDSCNGLIGQAWSIQALAGAASALEDERAASVAEQVFLAHPFDPGVGLWRCLEVDGRALDFDVTFNHQLWFAAAGALLAPHAGKDVADRVGRFLERLPASLGLRDGLVRHWVRSSALARRRPRYPITQWRARRRDPSWFSERENGYHAFNLHAFALLRRHTPDHPFWRSPKFSQLWQAAPGPDRLDGNPYAWPYNPVGFEMAVALEAFEGPCSRATQATWVTTQLARHWDAEAAALTRNTADPATLAARLYEATTLPNLPINPPPVN